MKTLLILAGGASSRMKASTPSNALSVAEIKAANSTNKGLIVLEGDQRPVLDYLIKNASEAGFTRIILITGTNQESFLHYYGNAPWNKTHLKVHVAFATQHIPKERTKPHGTADAVFQALEQYPELQNQAFGVCNCDNLYSAAAFKLLLQTPANNAFIAYDRDGLEFPAQKIARFAVCKLNASYYLENIKEKPEPEQLNEYVDSLGKLRVSMNIFKFSGQDFYSFLKACPEHPMRKEKELPTAILNMIKATNASLLGIPLEEHVPDLTTKEDILVFKQFLKK